MAGVFSLLAMRPATSLSTGGFISFVRAYGMFMGSSAQLARGGVGLLNMWPS